MPSVRSTSGPGRAVTVLLLLGMSVQSFMLWNESLPDAPTGPTLGQPLPSVGPLIVDGQVVGSINSVLVGHGTCSVVVGISPDCSFCREMRGTWQEGFSAWQDSVGVPIKAVWIAEADSLELDAFYASHSLPKVVKATLPAGSNQLRKQLGVYATPSVYLVDRRGRLRIGIIGHLLPPVDSTRAICRNAPQ